MRERRRGNLYKQRIHVDGPRLVFVKTEIPDIVPIKVIHNHGEGQFYADSGRAWLRWVVENVPGPDETTVTVQAIDSLFDFNPWSDVPAAPLFAFPGIEGGTFLPNDTGMTYVGGRVTEVFVVAECESGHNNDEDEEPWLGGAG